MSRPFLNRPPPEQSEPWWSATALQELNGGKLGREVAQRVAAGKRSQPGSNPPRGKMPMSEEIQRVEVITSVQRRRRW
jgi:hypothetical protein